MKLHIFHCYHQHTNEKEELISKHGKFGDHYKTYYINECCKCGKQTKNYYCGDELK